MRKEAGPCQGRPGEGWWVSGRAGQGGPWWVRVGGGHRGQADLQDVVNGSIELGGPASAWGGSETQHLRQGPCPLEFML